jgi:hypothetical protein
LLSWRHVFSLGNTRPITMMEFLSLLKPIQVISLGLWTPVQLSTLCGTISEIWPSRVSVLHQSNFEICTSNLCYEIVLIYLLQIAQFNVHKVKRDTGCYK